MYLLLLALISKTASSQITAKILIDKTNYCVPEFVTFGNGSSTGDTILYQWDFGNGGAILAPTNSAEPQSILFDTKGTYTVSLIAYSSITPTIADTAKISISVHNKPVPDFAIEDMQCAPAMYVLSDNSTFDESTLATSTWLIGGKKYTTQTVSHEFLTSGEFTVDYTVVDNNGCSKNISKKLTIPEKPNVVFTADINGSCEPPFSILFTNNSTASYPVEYTWKWDSNVYNGETLAEKKIEDYDKHSAVLIAKGDISNCIDSTSQEFQFTTYEPEIAVYKGRIDEKKIIAQGEIVPRGVYHFQCKTSVTGEIKWEINGETLYGKEVTKTFCESGNIPVTIWTNSDGECPKSSTFSFTVNKDLNNSFSYISNGDTVPENEVACNFDAYLENILPATSTQWYFNGDTLTGEKVSVYTCHAGEYPATLTASYNGECEDVISRNITIKDCRVLDIIVEHKGDTIQPEEAFCTDTATLINADSKQTSWWKYNNQRVRGNRASFIFCGDGNNIVEFINEYSYGCVLIDTIKVKTKKCNRDDFIIFDNVDSSVVIHDTTICKSYFNVFYPDTTVAFKNWMLQSESGIVNYKDSSFVFTSVENDYDVGLISISENGCVDTVIKTIHFDPVTSNFDINATYSCPFPISAQFYNKSFGAVSYNWYEVNNLDTVLLANTEDFQKTFQGKYVKEDKIYHSAQSFTKPIILVSTSEKNCKDTLTKELNRTLTTASINASPTEGCKDLDVAFLSDSKVTGINNPIVSYEWIYGDGTSQSFNYGNISGEADVFSNCVLNLNALSDSVKNLLQDKISLCGNDKSIFPCHKGTGYETKINECECINDKVSCMLSTITSVIPSYITEVQACYETAQQSTGKLVNHTYTEVGKYDAALIVSDVYGCTDTAHIEISVGDTVDISLEITAPDDTLYAGNNIGLIFSTNSTSEVSWHIMPYDENVVRGCGGSNHFNLEIAGYFSNILGFDVIANNNGCETVKGSLSLMPYEIFIVGMLDTLYTTNDSSQISEETSYGYVKIAPEVCKPQNISIQFQPNENLSNWAFNMGDGTIISNQTEFVHSYKEAGTYTLSFIADPNNPQNANVIVPEYEVSPNILQAEISMNMDDTVSCAYNPIVFSSEKSKGYVTNYYEPFLWFVDGVPKERTWKTSVELNSFLTLGDHTISLVAYDRSGCTDTAEITIRSTQPVSQTIFSKEYLCNTHDEVTLRPDLNDKSIESWKWLLADNEDFTTIPEKTITLTANTDKTQDILLIVKDTLGCLDTIKNSIIQYVPVANYTISQASICLGESVKLDANSAQSDSLIWILPNETTQTTIPLTFVPDSYGSHTVKQVAFKNNTCADTAHITVRVEQVDASFTISQNTICRNNELILQQKNIYDPVEYSLNFDNSIEAGFTTKLIAHSNTYSSGGAKHITLEVTSDANCTDTHDTTIYVVSAVPDISDKTICIGNEVEFTNTDTLANSYAISFGNGNDTVVADYTSLTSSYLERGVYTATFTATHALCTDTYSTSIIAQEADASFSISDSVICNYYESDADGTNIIEFTHLNKPDAIESGEWQYFENGETSEYNDGTSFFRYTIPGTQKASLIIKTSYGCTDTASRTITVNGTMGDYRESSNEICIEDSIRFTPFDMQYVDSLIWVFDDGFASNDLTPTHGYFTEGLFQPALKLFDTTGCVNIIVGNKIRVWDVVAHFDIKNELICQFDTLNIQEYSKDATEWLWNFGNTDELTEREPDTYAYQKPGKYTVQLIASNHIGCTDTALANIEVFRVPTPSFSISKDYLCGAGDTLSLAYDLNDASISSFIWSYGDNNSLYSNGTTNHVFDPASLNDTIIEHRYAYPRDTTLSIVLEATDTIGCVNRAIEPIDVYSPTVDFSILDKFACKGASVEIQHNSVYVDSVQWYYSNGGTETSLSNVAPIFEERGNYHITAIGYSKDRCRDTLVDSINVQEISAHFTVSDNYICDEDSIVFEHEYSPDPVTGVWTFEPASTSNYATSADSLKVHYFNVGGAYTVNLDVATSNGCTDSFDTLVYVNQALPIISDSTICINDTIDFSNNSGVAQEYIWTYGNGDTSKTTSNDVQSIVYPTRGDYTVTLIAYHPGCSDTISLANIINVQEVNANFSLHDPFVCIDDSLTVTHEYVPDAVTGTWKWGDNTDTAYINPAQALQKHKYSNGGDYTVTLEVQTSNGCADTASLPLVIIEALPIIPDYAVCEGDSIEFKNTYDYAANYEWDFSNGSTSNSAQNTPVFVTYPTRGNYAVKLKISTEFCTDSITVSAPISVENVDAAFSISDTSVCNSYPAKFAQLNNVTLTHTSYPDSITQGSWTIDGTEIIPYRDNSIANTAIQHLFTTVGTYKMALEVETQNGCKDKDSVEIAVYGAEGDFSVDKQIVCLKDSVLFTATNLVAVDSLVWQFKTGDVSNANPVYYTYNNEGTYYPDLILFTEQGCINELDSVQVLVTDVQAQFNFGRNNVCLTEDLAITDASYKAIAWSWVFGNGQIADVQIPQGIQYNANGDYAVQLIVTDQYGCKDSTEKTITVHPNPELQLSAVPLICLDSTALVTAEYNTDYSIEWYKDGIAYDNNTATIEDAFINGISTYQATVKDSYGCETTQAIDVETRPYPVLTQNLFDTAVVIAEKVELIVTSDMPQHYEWSPKELIEIEDSNRIIVKTLGSVTYEVTASDTCHTQTVRFNIEMYSSDSIPCNAKLPSAFSPNGDGENDRLQIRGWGLEELEFFRIYNRFGQVVFETKDLSKAWNGNFKGTPQNLDTYSYHYRIKTYCGFILEDKGHVDLLR